MLKQQHPEMQGPVEAYERLSLRKRWRMIADLQEKQRRDARAALDYARDEGLAEGLEKGLAEGQQALAEKERVIAESQQVIAEQDQTLAEKDREIAELRRRLEDKEI